MESSMPDNSQDNEDVFNDENEDAPKDDSDSGEFEFTLPDDADDADSVEFALTLDSDVRRVWGTVY